MESLLNTFLIGSGIAFLIYIYTRSKLNYWTRRGVGQLPNPHWFFGHFKDAILFKTAPGWHLRHLYQQSEGDCPFFGFYILHKPCMMIKDPEIIRQIFVKDFATFSDRYFSGSREKDSVGMRNLFGIRSPYWKILRRKIALIFTTQKFKGIVPLLLDNAKAMMDHIDTMKEDENGIRRVDSFDLNHKYATGIISRVSLGTPVDSFNDPNSEFSEKTSQFFYSTRRLRAVLAVFFLQEIVDLLGPIIYYDMTYFKRIFWKAVETREKTGEKRGDYIDFAVQLKNGRQDMNFKLEGDNLFHQTAHFLSGFETSSTAATFTLIEIAKNKEVQNRVREEIKWAIQQHGWSYEAFGDMPYLEQCVMEGLRLYPPVPFLDRITKEEYTIPGTDVVLERGTGVYVSVSALNRDPKFFPNPDEFDPDRFQRGAEKIEAFLPFGLGPKVCIGNKLGMLYIKSVLSQLIKKYDITYIHNAESVIDPRATFTLAVKGLNMELRKL